MRTSVRGKNIDLTDALKEYVHKKLSKVGRYFQREPHATVTLSVEKERHIVEVTIPIDGMILRAEDESQDMYGSVNQVVDKLERQIRKFKTRLNRRARRSDGEKPVVALAGEAAADDEDDDAPQVVRTKRFAVKPMDVDEAVLQMNLLGHDFFVFRHAGTDQVNVVYLRKDGNYGLIEPTD